MNQKPDDIVEKKSWEIPEINDLSFKKTEGGTSTNRDEGVAYGTHSVP